MCILWQYTSLLPRGGGRWASQDIFFSYSLIVILTAYFLQDFSFNDILTVFPIQVHGRKIDQDHYRVTIYIHIVVLESSMSCQVSLKSVHWFRRRFLKVFYQI